MKYLYIYSFIVQENLKIADHNILNAAANGMNLIVNNKLSTFMKHLRHRRHTCRSSKVCFVEKNKEWLENELILPPALNEDNHVLPTITKVCGRPPVNFNDASSKTKRRRLSPLVASVSSLELLFGVGCSLRQDGREKKLKLY